ncbi:uncharacterized protein [Dermacentor andersoni]|uniref:uncharacterized protein n=1 Tax=Dermacentor andersoni TaxID=34620 RepID=UPI003B3A7EA6
MVTFCVGALVVGIGMVLIFVTGDAGDHLQAGGGESGSSGSGGGSSDDFDVVAAGDSDGGAAGDSSGDSDGGSGGGSGVDPAGRPAGGPAGGSARGPASDGHPPIATAIAINPVPPVIRMPASQAKRKILGFPM